MGGRRIVGATDADIADLRGRYVGMVFQNPAAALNPVMTVAQQIGLPLYLHYDLTAAERAERIRVMLAKVGLDEDVLRMNCPAVSSSASASRPRWSPPLI